MYFQIDNNLQRVRLEQIGENLRDGYLLNEPEQDPSDVAEAATEYLNAKLEDVKDVVEAAVYTVAMKIAREPLVIQTVIEIFQERATGKAHNQVKEIGEDDEMFTMKYMKNKPIKDFKNEQFMKLLAAVETKLIELMVAEDISGQTTNATFLSEAQDLYKMDAFLKSVLDWNKAEVGCCGNGSQKDAFFTVNEGDDS